MVSRLRSADARGRSHGKLTKFGSVKFVFPKNLMAEMREHLTGVLSSVLPAAWVLYWT